MNNVNKHKHKLKGKKGYREQETGWSDIGAVLMSCTVSLVYNDMPLTTV